MEVAATPAAAVATTPAPSVRPKTSRRSKRSTTTRWTTCDANIDALSPHTSCPFAQNAFYEYWAAGGDSPLEVYSPAVGRAFTTECEDQGLQITCRTGDGGIARFSSTAVAEYDEQQALAYRSTHDTGTGSTSATARVAVGEAPEDEVDQYETAGEDEDLTGGEIPNYDSGTGFRVQCADGMYSKSGGRPGACSGHGGVG